MHHTAERTFSPTAKLRRIGLLPGDI